MNSGSSGWALLPEELITDDSFTVFLRSTSIGWRDLKTFFAVRFFAFAKQTHAKGTRSKEAVLQN